MPQAMSQLSFLILLALADADRHGYGIIKEIEERTRGATRPGTGALYLALQRLEDGGLIEESPERPDPAEDDARRRYYRLTALGRELAEAESLRLAVLVGVAEEKRLLPLNGLRAAKAVATTGRRS